MNLRYVAKNLFSINRTVYINGKSTLSLSQMIGIYFVKKAETGNTSIHL